MTNKEIVAIEKALIGVEEECYTFVEWKARGYRVKKGEKALITTRLWKKTKPRKDENGEECESRYFLAKSYLFSKSQVERIGVVQ